VRLTLTACAVLLLSASLLSGCWDMKSIQDLNYISAIGFDYENGEYIVYSQALDMSDVSEHKDSTGQPASASPIISMAKGATIQNAFDNLLKTVQVPHFTGFVGTLIFHERILKQGVLPIFEAMHRFGLIRYTGWVYATKEQLDEVLSTHSAKGVTPVTSVLREPYDIYKQRSFIEPIQFYQFAARFWEPSYTVLIPNLGIDREKQQVSGGMTRLAINGVQTLYRGKWGGFFRGEDVLGLRWMNPETEQAPLVLWEEKKPRAVLFIKKVKADVEPVQTDPNPRFRINVFARGFVQELFAEVDLPFIEKTAREEIAKQIRRTFHRGMQRGRDLFSLEHALFQQDFKSWKKFARNPDKKLSPDCLAEVNVEVKLTNSGKLKLEWYNYPEDILPQR